MDAQEQQELLLRSQDNRQMSSKQDTYYGSVEPGMGVDDREKLSMVCLMMLNMHAFNYGLFYASVGVILLPEEAMLLFPEQHAMYLAAMLGAAGLSQLVSPFVGYMSDRETNPLGRRMPYLIGGNAVLLVMIGALYVARTLRMGHAYLLLLLVAIIALNVAYTGFTGLVSDMVGSEQMGLCSGIMGGMTAAGAVLGLVCMGFVIPVKAAYPMYAVALVVCTPLTWYAAKDKPQEGQSRRPFDWTEVARSYYISPESHGDFFWVFVSRTFYYMAVSVQIYILYYLRDIIHIENAKAYTAILCILSQASSGIVSLGAAPVADRTGRKPAIYVALTMMAMLYIGYCFVDTYEWVVFLGICYGAGNGVYIAVDYALAVDCLPSQEEDGAKDLALWGVSAFLGTMFGPCLAGPLLAWLGHIPGSDHYSFDGYVALMGCGVIYCIGCGCALIFVRKGGEPKSIS